MLFPAKEQPLPTKCCSSLIHLIQMQHCPVLRVWHKLISLFFPLSKQLSLFSHDKDQLLLGMLQSLRTYEGIPKIVKKEGRCKTVVKLE